MTAPALARFAALLADPTRATFCLALLDGRAWTAGELAAHAGVTPATTTGHLHKLVAAGILTERRQGRHRYVRLADTRTAQLLEDLTAHLASATPPAVTLRAVTASAALARGRTCYDHLAGRLGVAITDALDRQGVLTRTGGFAITPAGLRWLADHVPAGPPGDARAVGRSGTSATGSRRAIARACLDWTERRDHLAGSAGAAICAHFLARSWITRVGTGRAVRVTPAGTTALSDILGPDPAWAPG